MVVQTDLRPAVRANAHQFFDACGRQDASSQALAPKPTDQILGEEHQFLVEGNPRLMARGQVVTGEDPDIRA